MCSCGTLGLSINRQSVKAHIFALFHRFAPADFLKMGQTKKSEKNENERIDRNEAVRMEICESKK